MSAVRLGPVTKTDVAEDIRGTASAKVATIEPRDTNITSMGGARLAIRLLPSPAETTKVPVSAMARSASVTPISTSQISSSTGSIPRTRAAATSTKHRFDKIWSSSAREISRPPKVTKNPSNEAQRSDSENFEVNGAPGCDDSRAVGFSRSNIRSRLVLTRFKPYQMKVPGDYNPW